MKRFTETQKWEDPWFRRLEPEMKLLWQWILDRCDNAGVIDPDIELASFQIGYQYPMDTLLEFGERVQRLSCGKWFIPKFIGFQYGKISTECKAHNPVFQSLEKHGLKGYSKGIHTLQEEEEVKDTVKVTEKEKPDDALFTLTESPKPPKSKANATPEMVRIGKLLNRRDSTPWKKEEIKAFHECDFLEDEIVYVEAFYAATERDGDPLHRRTGLLSLLNHWPDEVGKAQAWAKKYGRPLSNRPFNPTGK